MDGASGPDARGDAIPVIRLKEVDSTSLFARRLANTGQFRRRAAVVVAEKQTAGVGRFRRQWVSPAGGLWCTLVWPLASGRAGDAALEGLGLRVGMACLDLVDALMQDARGGAEVRLKWPNDVMINGRKVAGVLCELVQGSSGAVSDGGGGGGGDDRYVLVGVGLNANVSSAVLPGEIREKSCGLLDHVPRSLDLERVREGLVLRLSAALRCEGVPGEMLRRARQRLFGLNTTVSVSLPHGQKVFGELIGLSDQGMAILRTDDGPYVAPSGTVLMSE